MNPLRPALLLLACLLMLAGCHRYDDANQCIALQTSSDMPAAKVAQMKQQCAKDYPGPPEPKQAD